MNIIIMILLISLLIIVHEFGHFLAAKAFKMRVDRFGFGLPVGPTLLKKRIGETDFVLHPLLLGGYVSFPDDDKDSTVPEDSQDRFLNRPIYQRSIVISMGVIANFICAVALVLFVGAVWHKLPANQYTVSVSKVLDSASYSVKKAGFEEGDILYSVNGTKIIYPNILLSYVAKSQLKDGTVSKESYENALKKLLEINPKISDKEMLPIGTVINIPERQNEKPVSLTNDQVLGLEPYDSQEIELLPLQKTISGAIGNAKRYELKISCTIQDIAYAIADNGKPLNITVLRHGQEINLPSVFVNSDGFLGIEQQIQENFNEIKNPIDAIKYTNEYIKVNSELMIYGLGKVFSGKVPAKELHGIVAITKIGSDVITYQGIFKGLLLTAIISLNLAFLNLLPIPALDGGHLLFLLIEKIQGRPVDEKLANQIGNFFFYILILLMILIIFNDIAALITDKI